MPHFLLTVAVALTTLVSAVPQNPSSSDKRTRDLHVGVIDAAGKPVLDLTEKDFVVREDGTEREVLKVGPSTAPLTISILVDDSQAAQPTIQQMRLGLTSFVAALPDNAQIALSTFGERPTLLVDYTTGVEQLKRGVNKIFSRSGAGSYMLDAIAEVSRGFQKLKPARPVIVVLTVEGVEFSNMRHEATLKELRKAGAVLHILAIGSPSADREDEARSRQILMDEGTRTTGGRREQLLTEMAIPEKLKQLADDLNNWKQYQITYGRPERLVPPDMVEVSVKGPGLRAVPPTRAAER